MLRYKLHICIGPTAHVVCFCRHVVPRSSSADAPALAALLGRSASGKQKPSQPGWPYSMGSAAKQPFQNSDSSSKHSVTATRPADSQSVASQAFNSCNSGGFCINAAKPDLLAQIQAIRVQQPPAAPVADINAVPPRKQANDKQAPILEQPKAMATGTIPLTLHWYTYCADGCMP